MTKSYHARLRLEASVPEKPIVEPFLKAFVEFEVLCPKRGPRRKNHKKNGFDKDHSKIPQLFFCKRCRSSFYAHTSWLFTQLSDVLLERIVHDLFEERLAPKAVAAVHHVSPSLISSIRHHFREALEQKLAILAERRARLRQEAQLPVPLEWGVWWDETFFTLGDNSWCLILLVNARGEPLAWKFSRTRKVDDYLDLLSTIRATLPPIIIFVGDAWTAYQKTCKKLKEECFLIEHVHSHPWDKVRLHHFQPEIDKDMVHQTSLEIPFQGFVSNKPVEGKAYTRSHKISNPSTPTRKPGRPKGSKDRKKRRSRHAPRRTSRGAKKGKRECKSLAKHGRLLCFHPQPIPVGWNIEWLSPPLTGSSLLNSSIEELELLLDITYKLMGGGVIQSNRIEVVHREIKTIVSDRGLKSSEQVSRVIDDHLRYWGNHFSSAPSKETVLSPITPSTAFARLFEFFHPSIESLSIFSCLSQGGL